MLTAGLIKRQYLCIPGGIMVVIWIYYPCMDASNTLDGFLEKEKREKEKESKNTLESDSNIWVFSA